MVDLYQNLSVGLQHNPLSVSNKENNKKKLNIIYIKTRGEKKNRATKLNLHMYTKYENWRRIILKQMKVAINLHWNK